MSSCRDLIFLNVKLTSGDWTSCQLQAIVHKTFAKIIQRWPGKKYFGMYRFLPVFFAGGALLEFSMINWHVGQTNFYRTYKRRQVEKLVEEKLTLEGSA